MSPAAKRTLSSQSRSVSPPALRRKLSSSTNQINNVTPTWVTAVQPDHARIFSWNVNGVGPLIQKQLSFKPGSPSPLRIFLHRHSFPQLLCLQEVKISAKDVATQRQLQLAANLGRSGNEPTYSIEFSLPRDKYNATGFGGKVHGVASLIRDDFAPGILTTRKPDWDLEGRVLIHEHENGLVVVNGYWVNGTNNAYKDPVSGRVNGTRHDHKLRFHQHMLDAVLQLQVKGCHVVLVGDMNVAPAPLDGKPSLRTSPVQHCKNRADFNAKFLNDGQGMHGVDTFRHLHGDKKRFTYHPRGGSWGSSCDRVDLIICDTLTRDLGVIQDTNICDTALERGHSDHVPLWVAIDLKSLRHQDRQECQSAVAVE